jgi:LuxR family maltose regulon positive regulatory protein
LTPTGTPLPLQSLPLEGGPPSFAFDTIPTRAIAMLMQADPLPKLVTVCAPPGYGKTVLLSRLHEEFVSRGCRCLWVQLDDRDIDLSALLHRMRTALEYVGVSTHSNGAEPKLPFADRGAAAEAMVKLLTGLPNSTLLFVDNLGFCEDKRLTLFLERLVFASGSSLRLVLSSTHAIPIDTVRAKLDVGAFELSARHLSFDRESTALLLKQVGIAGASDAELDGIVAQTEGWPAAVRLLQVLLAVDVNRLGSVASPDIERVLSRFNGDHSDIARVLTHRVLVGFEQAVVQFMIEVALVREFNADLAAHMTGRAEARDWLNMLVQRNILIFPLDSSRRWFRFHTLMREFLLVEAEERCSPARRREVLDRAARWHQSRGDNVTAMGLALEAGSNTLAQELLNRIAHVVVGDHGQMASLIKWVDRLLEAGVAPSLEVHVWFVWALCDSLQYERARHALDEFDQRVTGEVLVGAAASSLHSRLLFLHMLVNVFTDRLDAAYEQANSWLDNGGEGAALIVSTVTSIAGIAEIDRGDLTAARLRMGQARPAIDRSDSAYGLAWVGILRACIEIGQARPDRADQVLLEVRAQVVRVIGNEASPVITIDFVHARALLDLGRVEAARELALRGLRRAMHNGIMVSLENGLIACMALWEAPGDDTFNDALLEQVVHSYPARGQALLGASKVRRLLELARFGEAMAEAQHIGLTGTGRTSAAFSMRERGDWMLARLELELVHGSYELVLSQVDVQLKQAALQGRDRDRLELLLIAADAHQRMGKSSKALRPLSMAIALATPGNVVQPFKVRSGLLEALLAGNSDKELGLIQPAERFFLERLRFRDSAPVATGELRPAASGTDEEVNTTKTAATVGTPSLREIQLLALLDEGLSNEQAADRMSLSVTTVKWHLHNVYGKLGVRSRSAALARARALNLIGR